MPAKRRTYSIWQEQMGQMPAKLEGLPRPTPQVHGPQQEMERLREELVRAHSVNGRLQLQVRGHCTTRCQSHSSCLSFQLLVVWVNNSW